MTPTQVGFCVAALAAAAYGLVFERRRTSIPRTLLKFAGAAALSVTARTADAPTFLGLALALSAVGDAALAADPKRYLPAGLCAFLGAHIVYAVLFAEIGAPAVLLADPVRGAAALAAAVAAGGFALWLWPRLGALRGPVTGYAAAIAAMTALSFGLPASFWPAMLGAGLFMASDAILAARLFRYEGRPHVAADQAVWWLYAAAQGCIAWAFLRPWSW